MRVKSWSDGRRTFGLRVGVPNSDCFFQPDWDEVEIEIEGAAHLIRITGGFWNQCPELRDPVLRDWLQRHRSLQWPNGAPHSAELVPLGGNRFRLVP